MSDEMADDPGSDSLGPAGMVGDYSSGSSGSQSLEEEQALWVRRRREITELELAKRRGELVPIADVRTQSAAMGRRIRIALDKIHQHLPAHLSPESRSECERAIAVAVSAAMATV
jgi:phage terminase Nu1 subunit (DNA packaging protein)